MYLTRRTFLRLLAAGGAVPLVGSCRPSPPSDRVFDIPGRIVNASPISGHLLYARHDAKHRPPQQVEAVYDVIVVGGGVSGLSAAWKLKQSGVERLLVLEAGAQPGGTSISGSVNGTAFPWGAHYINIPPSEADCIKEVLEDLGVITGYDANGRPQIAEGHRLRAPQERLFIEEQWVEDLDPFVGADVREKGILGAFEDEMLRWMLQTGKDGRRAFAMPLLYSSKDGDVRQLDQMTMAAYMQSRQWRCPRLDWLVNYACRDDYGGTIETVSAWAGIHYFACRFYDSRLNDLYPADTLTWDQGNAYLVSALMARLSPQQVRTNCLVLRLTQQRDGVHLVYLDTATGTYHRLSSKAVVYAGKLHTAPFVITDLPDRQRQAMAACTYSPWLVAAIHVSRMPQGTGARPAWDNVLYDSASLGYIVADHQRRRTGSGAPAVLVYYRPFVLDLARARHELLHLDHGHWVNHVMRDLIRAHPDLDQVVERMDIYRWGHAMIRPEPGIIWGAQSRWRREPFGAIFFAGCDTTGLPLFEEACFSGIHAAERSMKRLGIGFETSLKGLEALG